MPSSVRDQGLLDALEAVESEPFEATVWRSVREGRRADICGRSGGRWDDRSFDVLYASLTREGAIEERRFNLFRGQPFAPTKIQFVLYTVQAHLNAVLRFDTPGDLAEVGLNVDRYGSPSYVEKDAEYPRSQEIAEAAYFLGADGLLVPNARHDSLNLIVFCEQDPPVTIEAPERIERLIW